VVSNSGRGVRLETVFPRPESISAKGARL
jgi:hypothetical protein